LISSWLIIACSLIYIALLFAIAYIFERRKTTAIHNTWVYSLSLAIFCTSWAFYGTIQQAASTGWFFAPTYVGAILLLFLGWRFLSKLVSVGQHNNITSISDFISSRYGKSQRLAGTITFIALVALVPYIALQLKALTTSYTLLTAPSVLHQSSTQNLYQDAALYISLLMALFAIVFGTRRVDATEHQTGIIHAVAFESIVKLIAFIALGIYVCYHFFDGVSDVLDKAQSIPKIQSNWQQNYSPMLFWTHTLLGLLAIFCLPRQFHVLVVENKDVHDVKRSRWIFSSYLLLINIFILPIAVAGLIYFNHESVPADTFILAFPLSEGSELFALIGYIGGFSAATSMIIIVSVVLSTMISNDIILPLAIHFKWLKNSPTQNLQKWLLRIRRAIIVGLLLLAFIYYRTIASAFELASIGLLSFSLVAQFAPSIIGAIYWKQGNKVGVIAGLLVGIATWIYLLLIPSLATSGYLEHSVLHEPWFGIEFLAPGFWLNGSIFDSLTLGVFWSLALNTLTFIFVSLNVKPSASEKLQALQFVAPRELTGHEEQIFIENKVTLKDLFNLSERFIGEKKNKEFIQQHYGNNSRRYFSSTIATVKDIELCQKRLSRVIGGSSAQIVMDTVTGKKKMPLHDVVDIVDEASQVFTFNRELLQSAMENISHGISVIDRDLKLVAWNKQYQQLFHYPDDLLTVGRPIEDLIRFNAEQGLFGEGDQTHQVRKRLNYLKNAAPHTFERKHNQGKVLKVQGNPMPGGGFVTVFIDITELRQKQEELAEINSSLEERVSQRTYELLEINQELDHAKHEADEANQSKTRFLAAASHDILQPINAASLFTQALLEQQTEKPIEQQLKMIKKSLLSADELLSDLLDISKMDAGVIEARIDSFPLQKLFNQLAAEFSVIAKKKNIQLRVSKTTALVSSDSQLLKRILQNFLSNAIRYTREGGKVLLGARRRQDSVEIQVLDNGIGIAPDNLSAIFEEFTRADPHSSAPGHGLGLAIVQRCATLLEHSITVDSKLGKGSCFGLSLPTQGFQSVSLDNEQDTIELSEKSMFHNKVALCIDNDESIQMAMQQLLEQWGFKVHVASSKIEAIEMVAALNIDIMLVDYHLNNGERGLDVIESIHEKHWVPAVLITADRSQEVSQAAIELDIPIAYKPVKAFRLRTLLKKILL